MARSNKGIRDLVKDSRFSSEQRVISSSQSNSNNNLGQSLGGVGTGILSTAGQQTMANPKMASMSSNVYGMQQQNISSKITSSNNLTGNLLKQKNMNEYNINQSEFSKDVDSINKLSSATSKLFDTENNLPDIKDSRVLGNELRRIIEEQRKELEHRNQTVQALQRNFESLSTLCINERAEKTNLLKLNEQIKQENKEYAQQIVGMSSKIEGMQKEIEGMLKDKKKYDKMREDYSNVKTQLDAAKQQIEIKNQKIENIGNECNQVKSQLKELKEKYANFDQEMKEQEKLKEEMRLYQEVIDAIARQRESNRVTQE
eukprot:403347810